MPTPTILLGRMRMREDLTVTEQGNSSGERTLALTGQESIPRLSPAAVERQREDFLTMPGKFIPVTFQVKTYLNGFYSVRDASGTVEDWDDDLKVFRWSANLTRVGTDSEVDIESRLSGSISRQNNFAVVGVRSHAPAIGHVAYWTDATVTSAISRTGEDGILLLYSGLGAEVSPRWIVDPLNYGGGRVQFTDEFGLERAGDSARLPAIGWELSNGLVRVRPLAAGGVLEISGWSNGGWVVKNWDVLFDAVSVGAFDFCSILTNEHGLVSLRLVKAMTNGRLYMDVILRRGYRFAELYVQSEYGGTIKVTRTPNAAGSNTVGGTVVSNAFDNGAKWIVGSSRTFTPDVVTGGISIAATPVLDAFVGFVVEQTLGGGAIAGDDTGDLQKQYIGAPTELVRGVRR